MSQQKEIKLAIVGSRDFTNFSLFKEKVEKWIENNGKPTLIISGGAKGTDTMAEKYALEKKIPTLIYKPDYVNCKSGLSAPLERNTLIVNDCTHVLAFPTSSSRGTFDTIRKAKKSDKVVDVVYVD